MVISKHLDSFLLEGSRGQNKFFSGLFLERIIFYVSDHVIFISKNVQSYFLSKIKVALEKKLLAGLQTENCKFNEAQARSAVTLTHTLLLEN